MLKQYETLKHPFQLLLLHGDTHTRDGGLSPVVRPASLDFDMSACKRLISRDLSQHEVISLIEVISNSQEEVKMVSYLNGDDALNFIDMMHEVCLSGPSLPKHSLIPSLSRFCPHRSDFGSPWFSTTALEEVFERSVQDMRPSWFGSEFVKNPALL